MTAGGNGSKEKIKFTNLCKSFGDLLVLNNLNFSVKENDFLCIVGPTGCGKTTLCNLITTLIPPTEGTVEINGEPADPRRHNISFVFQEPSCLPWRTLWDDIKFGLEIKGYSQKEIRERVSKIIDLVGLKDFVNYYPYQISAGMKQRAAIARAFVTQPDLLLMDEPFGQLDIKARFHMMDEVLKLWREIKATIVYVTHNLEEAVYLGQNILVLTQKPTHIKATIAVDLPHPRDYSDPRFVEIRKRLTELVKWW
jgi:ABC-type nitrate/sulfonate/bicarbonate transport system ATPase subunit